MNNPKIAVINISSFGTVYPEFVAELQEKVGPIEKFTLAQHMSQEELAEVLKGFTYVLLGNYPNFGETFFENNRDVKLIARHGIGVNNIDIEAANRHKVYVTKMVNKIETHAVAEQAVSLLMSVSKCITIADRKVHAGQWQTKRLEMLGHQIYGKTTGIIGFGYIGKRFAQIMKYGYDNQILVYDPYAKQNDLDELGVTRIDLNGLLERSDFISIHANLTDETRHMINAETLKRVKHDAILINTARGPLVDESALYEALIKLQLFGYGADVSEKEPIEPDNRLLSLDRVIITPHSAIYNKTCMEEMNRKVMEDIYHVEAGELPSELLTNF